MAIQWFPAKASKITCKCVADNTQFSTVVTLWRGKPRKKKRSRKVRHWRLTDDAYFWHWEDNIADLHYDNGA